MRCRATQVSLRETNENGVAFPEVFDAMADGTMIGSKKWGKIIQSSDLVWDMCHGFVRLIPVDSSNEDDPDAEITLACERI